MVDLSLDGFTESAAAARPLLRAFGDLRRQFEAERTRWILWLPVAVGTGDVLYFSLPEEPFWLIGPLLVVLSSAALGAAWRSGVWPTRAVLPLIVLCAMASGFSLAEFEAWRVAAPALTHTTGPVLVRGRVADIDWRGDGARVTIEIARIWGGGDARPRLARVTLHHPDPALAVGDRLSVRAVLMPPPPPSIPGGLDFQRQAYFQGIGAVGYQAGPADVTPAERSGLTARIRALRLAMAARIHRALPGASGSIAAAMITGERGAIPESVADDYRDTGLSHLLVIAGLHMSLVTGFVFFAVRAVLALIPAMALRHPIKKWSAIAALAAASIYLLLSGGAVPTQRAFVMVGLGLLAILVDRWQLSMRGLAAAALAVLVLDPVAVMGVSFQMSFAAVAGLIAFYEVASPWLASARSGAGMARRIGLAVGHVIATTLVVTLATAPYSIHHFNRFALFSVIANFVAVPLAGLWIMPWAVVSCLLMPFGVERFGLVPMGWGLDLVALVAHWTAHLPDAVATLPSLPGVGFAAVTLGGLWLLLWQGRWRLWGLAPLIAGLMSVAWVTPPDLLVSADGRLIAVRAGDFYLVSSDRAEKIDAANWAQRTTLPMRGELPRTGEAGSIDCTAMTCRWPTSAGLAIWVRDRAAIEDSCAEAAIVVTALDTPVWCRETAETVIDRSALERDGATQLWFGAGIRRETANSGRGHRAWAVSTTSVSSGGSVRPDAPVP